MTLSQIYAAALKKYQEMMRPINAGVSTAPLDFKATTGGDSADAEAIAKDPAVAGGGK